MKFMHLLKLLVFLFSPCIKASPVNTNTDNLTCLNWNEKEHSDDCLNDIQKCKVEKCKPNSKCTAFYKRERSGTLKLKLMECYNADHSVTCGNDSCPLKVAAIDDYFQCCCSTPLCNDNILYSTTKPTTTSKPPGTTKQLSSVTPEDDNSNSHYLLPVFIIVTLSAFIIVVGVFLCVRRRKLNAFKRSDALLLSQTQPQEVALTHVRLLHQGHFSQVSLSQSSVGREMAVKSVGALLHQQWLNERGMFVDYKLRHPNIVAFIGANTVRDEDLSPKYLIMLEYEEKGTLLEYLKQNSFGTTQLFRLLFGIVHGLVYLHTEEGDKPRIAHRDIKSTNVLLTRNLECVICDFGLAMAPKGQTNTVAQRSQVGTNRYMAPEILEGALTFNTESFFYVDIYSLSLVIWEILSKYQTEMVEANEHKLPYFDTVGQNPSVWLMKECVVDRALRPNISPEWRKHRVISSICVTMEECWDMDPEARISAHCIEQRLKTLVDNVTDLDETLATCETTVAAYCSSEISSSSDKQASSVTTLDSVPESDAPLINHSPTTTC